MNSGIENFMNPMNPSSRLLNGIIIGLVFESAALIILCEISTKFNPNSIFSERYISIPLSISFSVFIFMLRFIKIKYFLRDRYPFVLDDEIAAALIGRLIGVAIGTLSGIYIVTTISY